MPWFLTPHGPHFVVEPGTVDEYERRDYVVMTTQQVTDYYAGVAFPDPPSFATEAEVLPLVTSAVTAGTGALPAALRAAYGRPAALAKLDVALSTRTMAPKRIVFWGSSTTAGSNATSVANRYVDRFVAALQAAYPSGLGTESTVVASTTAVWGTLTAAVGVHGYNAGDGGTTSADFLTAGEITNTAALAPSAAMYMIGANDFKFGVPVATYKANVQAAIDASKAAMTTPCVHILVHTYQRYDASITPVAAWSAYGRALAEIAAADPENVAFIDISEAYELLGIPGSDPLNLIDTDEIHQTDAGHAFMAELLCRALGIPGPRKVSIVTPTAEIVHSRVFSDSFSGADATELHGRTLDAALGGPAGKTWTVDPAAQLAVAGGRLVRGAGTLATFFGGVQLGVLDAEVSFVVSALPVGANLILDLQRQSASTAGSPDAYRATLSPTGTMTVVQRIGGTTTTLAGSAAAGSAAVGDRITLRYRRGVLELLVNGLSRWSQAVSSITTPGWAGLAGTATTTALTVDNVTADVLT